MKCSKCEGEMEKGFIADRAEMSASTKQQWGTDLQWGGIAGVKNRHEVETYRCIKCGYLESYAK